MCLMQESKRTAELLSMLPSDVDPQMLMTAPKDLKKSSVIPRMADGS